MPIPTRTKSMSARTTSDLPTHKPSMRQGTREVISTATPASTQTTINDTVRKTSDARIHTASQIRPPNLHMRDSSTVSSPMSITDTPSRRLQHPSAPTKSNSSHIRQPSKASIISNQRPSTNSRLAPTVQDQYSNKTAFVRPLREKQPAVTATRPARPQSVTSLVSESSNTLAPSESGHFSILQSRPRDELLQLSITHLSSRKVLDTYEQNAQQNVITRTRKIAGQETDLLRLERQRQHTVSSRDLRSWLDRDGDTIYGQQIQNISMAIHDLNSYDLEVKHTETLLTFQHWLERSLDVQQKRTDEIEPKEMQFIASLDHQWHRQASEVEHHLSIITTALEEMEPATRPDRESSGIATVFAYNLRLARVLLREVETAIIMERTVMLAEREWKQEQIRKAQNQLSSVPVDADVGMWVS